MSKKASTNIEVDITDFQNNPLKVIESAKSGPICVLVDGEPSFYCVAADLFERQIENLKNLEQLIVEGENSGDVQEWDFEKFTQVMKSIKGDRLKQKRLDTLSELSALDQDLGFYEIDEESEPEQGNSLIELLRETAEGLVESGLLSKDSDLMKSIEECEQDLKNGDYKEIDDVDAHVEGLLKNSK